MQCGSGAMFRVNPVRGQSAFGLTPSRVDARQKSAMISGITTVIRTAMKQPPDPTARLFVQIIETAEGGFGVDGRVFVPRAK